MCGNLPENALTADIRISPLEYMADELKASPLVKKFYMEYFLARKLCQKIGGHVFAPFWAGYRLKV